MVTGLKRPAAMLHRKRHTTYARTAKRDIGMLSHLNHVPSERYGLSKYRVAHLVQERNMLTSDSKIHWWPGTQKKLSAKCNFQFGVNIFLSRSRWATL